ncbi:MAG: LptF/LptG family permease [Candidatus Margulisiibacteriota bacterium]
MISILDRYLTKELIGPFVFGIAAFTCILAGSTILFQMIGEAIKYGIPWLKLLQIIVYKMPNIIVFTFPMSMLLSSIITFGRLSSDLEIMAFRAGGVSFARLVVPVVAVGLVVSLMTIWFNESIVPRATYSAEKLFRSFSEKDQPKLKKNINFTEYDGQGMPLRIINVLEIENGDLRHITVAEYDHGSLSRLIRAEHGAWVDSGGWAFQEGTMYVFPVENPEKAIFMVFDKEVIDIKINPLDLTSRPKSVEEMTSKELKKSIEFQRQTGRDPINDILRFHMKFSVPFASLIFAILGAAVGVRPHRSSSALGLGISLVIILVYYVLISVGMGLGLSHAIPAWVAAWMPNLVVGGAALILLRKVSSQ